MPTEPRIPVLTTDDGCVKWLPENEVNRLVADFKAQQEREADRVRALRRKRRYDLAVKVGAGFLALLGLALVLAALHFAGAHGWTALEGKW